MTDTVNIDGLRPEAVLAALYNNSRPLGLGMLHYDPTDMGEDEARSLLAEDDYFDYLKGRVMKVRIPGPDDPQEIQAAMYDRDNGPGALAAVVESLRAKADA